MLGAGEFVIVYLLGKILEVPLELVRRDLVLLGELDHGRVDADRDPPDRLADLDRERRRVPPHRLVAPGGAGAAAGAWPRSRTAPAGEGGLVREFSSVHQIPQELQNLPAPSGVHQVPRQPA